MKLLFTFTYEIENDDNATDEEIIQMIIDEDEYFNGNWNFNWGL